jgi:hypothetical protein
MKFIIETTKPDEVEKELKKQVEATNKPIKFNRYLKMLAKIGHINIEEQVKLFKAGTFCEYERLEPVAESKITMFKFTFSHPNERATKDKFIKGFNKILKDLDPDVIVTEVG